MTPVQQGLNGLSFNSYLFVKTLRTKKAASVVAVVRVGGYIHNAVQIKLLL